MSWIAVLFAIEAGFMPMNSWIEYPHTDGTAIAETYYTHLDGEALLFDAVFVGGHVTTYMVPAEYGFSPTGATYEFRAGFRFEPLDVGFRHVCGPHPVNAYPQFGVRRDIDGAFEGAYEQVYVRLEGELK